MAREQIYLDHHASTPVDPRVLEAMLPTFTETYGNPASRSHAFGWKADGRVKHARGQVARLIGARSPREVLFTSGATESNNLAIRGPLACLAGARDGEPPHVVTSAIEHPSVLGTCRTLAKRGQITLTELGVDGQGRVSPADVEAAIRPETRLISIMSVNNEVGTIQPVAEIGRIARSYRILFHTDASQAVGRIPVHVVRDHVDLLSLSSHKIYGPKGVGALYVRRLPDAVPLESQQTGGGQEFGLRSGTLNVPGIVGLGMAAELVTRERDADERRLLELREGIHACIKDAMPDVVVHGSLSHRVASNLTFSIPGLDGEILLAALPQLALSAGSACSSGSREPSHVLAAMGVSKSLARGAIRLGLGRTTTRHQASLAGKMIGEVARRLSSSASLRGS